MTSKAHHPRLDGSATENAALDSDLGKLFEHQLQDTYYAENAIIKALPKMIKAAHSEELKHAFEKHLTQTEGHVNRLERVFQMIGRKAEATPCEAIKGIIREGDEIAAEFGKTRAGDAGLAAAAQAVEHYEIARYGALKAWAHELGLEKAVTVLEATEVEEIDADQVLSDLAAQFNAIAAGADVRP
jgi:ferritin-like metal-binding protein YciE